MFSTASRVLVSRASALLRQSQGRTISSLHDAGVNYNATSVNPNRALIVGVVTSIVSFDILYFSGIAYWGTGPDPKEASKVPITPYDRF